MAPCSRTSRMCTCSSGWRSSPVGRIRAKFPPAARRLELVALPTGGASLVAWLALRPAPSPAKAVNVAREMASERRHDQRGPVSAIAAAGQRPGAADLRRLQLRQYCQYHRIPVDRRRAWRPAARRLLRRQPWQAAKDRLVFRRLLRLAVLVSVSQPLPYPAPGGRGGDADPDLRAVSLDDGSVGFDAQSRRAAGAARPLRMERVYPRLR